MADQTTDNDQSPSGNPNMAVQKDAKGVPVRGDGSWSGAEDNDDHQEFAPIPSPTKR